MIGIYETVLIGLSIAAVVIGPSALLAIALCQMLKVEEELDKEYDRAWGIDNGEECK